MGTLGKISYAGFTINDSAPLAPRPNAASAVPEVPLNVTAGQADRTNVHVLTGNTTSGPALPGVNV